MSGALVSNIQRFSLDDGPGMRTTVFFKGCSLSCAWCHNPECIGSTPVLQFNGKQCASCGVCADKCPNGAHAMKDGEHVFSREKCAACGKCAPACRKGALKQVGQPYEPEELLRELLKDRTYFSTSGGGITFSGGEPALLPEDTARIARLCKEAGLHVALDTAGHVPFRNYELLLPHVDLFLYDVKCFDPDLHKQWTGSDNVRILKNLKRLNGLRANLVIRVPVIKGFNDTPGEHEGISALLAPLNGVSLVELLPYHSYGAGKYETLGIGNTIADHTPPSKEFMEEALQKYTAKGLNAVIS